MCGGIFKRFATEGAMEAFRYSFFLLFFFCSSLLFSFMALVFRFGFWIALHSSSTDGSMSCGGLVPCAPVLLLYYWIQRKNT